MNKLWPFLFLFIAMINGTCISVNNAHIIQLQNGHYLLRSGNLAIEVDPGLGARIISAKLDDDELLLQKRDGLLNWGSTFWLGPQSLWNWPPPEAIQLGKYAAEIQEGKLLLTSDIEQQFGYRVVKKLSLNDGNSLNIEYQIINETDSAQQIGPWEITVVPAEGAMVFFPTGAIPDATNSTIEFNEKDGVARFEYNEQELQEVQKIFRNPSEGWLAHINKSNTLLVKKFDVIPPLELAPGPGNVEVYISKKSKYIELENHGKYTLLEPGELLEYEVKWFITKLPEEFSKELIEHVRTMIQ